ncbi:MAG TPA: hypothetical protein PK370_03240 [Candidatus Woesebacteria bacterium]|nr:hypothetical protein [Candidatus Woesebacteria bacterium]HPJ16923.1 hypothetical protein [Candidatus Woesebacteria bacterium]
MLKLGLDNPQNCARCHCKEFSSCYLEGEAKISGKNWVPVVAVGVNREGRYYCFDQEEDTFTAVEGAILRLTKKPI